MFGYILPDKPNMFMKDYALYKSFYCGMCLSIKKNQSNLMRLSVNYDVTFITILLHGICNTPLKFVERGCVLNPFKKKRMVDENPLMQKCVFLNTLLVDFKLDDDLSDKPSLAKKILRGLIKRNVKKSTYALPEIAKLLKQASIDQAAAETAAQTSFDMVAHPFAMCMKQIFGNLCGDKFSEEIGTVAYFLAKYVYLLDALDDFESDIKNNQFNVFKNIFPDSKSFVELMQNHKDYIDEILGGITSTIRENYQNIPVFNTEGVITNTLWYGLGARAKQIMMKENKKCQKTRTKF